MAIRKIARMGNPVLNRIAAAVAEPSDPEIARLAGDMKDTLIDIGGSGIAAPQVFESLRIVVYRLSPRMIEGMSEGAQPWVTMINPVLSPLGEDKVAGWERCLSIPGLHGKVERYQKLSCEYQTLAGESVSHEVEAAHAVLLQHECDHLDGILYPMQMADLSTLEYDAEPGHLARDVAAGETIWPRLKQLVEDWPGREQWLE